MVGQHEQQHQPTGIDVKNVEGKNLKTLKTSKTWNLKTFRNVTHFCNKERWKNFFLKRKNVLRLCLSAGRSTKEGCSAVLILTTGLIMITTVKVAGRL